MQKMLLRKSRNYWGEEGTYLHIFYKKNENRFFKVKKTIMSKKNDPNAVQNYATNIQLINFMLSQSQGFDWNGAMRYSAANRSVCRSPPPNTDKRGHRYFHCESCGSDDDDDYDRDDDYDNDYNDNDDYNNDYDDNDDYDNDYNDDDNNDNTVNNDKK